MAANVVDLPLPVGPVTKTNPFSFLAKSASIAGRPRSDKLGISTGIVLKTIASPLF